LIWATLTKATNPYMQRSLLIALFLIIALHSNTTLASLSRDQARKLIASVAGAKLPGKAVRIRNISGTESEAEATAEIETAFRIIEDKNDQWRLFEVRMGQDRWEEVPLIAAAAGSNLPQDKCSAPELRRNELSVKRARCVIANALHIDLPSDSVRVLSISDLGLPFASRPSMIVSALVQADVKFQKAQGKWLITQIRTGDGPWIDVESVVSGLNDEKRKRAQSELATLASALEQYHKESGFYIVSEKHPVLVDHLSPRYLSSVIRLDPWRHPYQYQGDRDHFQLRSFGPDGLENTADDIVVNSSK
jgi:Type II secretion system (T2SS), protein G